MIRAHLFIAQGFGYGMEMALVALVDLWRDLGTGVHPCWPSLISQRRWMPSTWYPRGLSARFGGRQLGPRRWFWEIAPWPLKYGAPHALVTSGLHYCQLLCLGLVLEMAQKLQLVQNTVALTLMGAIRFQCVTPILQELHWLPIILYAPNQSTLFDQLKP